jgi:hypothetical protein
MIQPQICCIYPQFFYNFPEKRLPPLEAKSCKKQLYVYHHFNYVYSALYDLLFVIVLLMYVEQRYLPLYFCVSGSNRRNTAGTPA